jgi:hypothetical protein
MFADRLTHLEHELVKMGADQVVKADLFGELSKRVSFLEQPKADEGDRPLFKWSPSTVELNEALAALKKRVKALERTQAKMKADEAIVTELIAERVNDIDRRIMPTDDGHVKSCGTDFRGCAPTCPKAAREVEEGLRELQKAAEEKEDDPKPAPGEPLLRWDLGGDPSKDMFELVMVDHTARTILVRCPATWAVNVDKTYEDVGGRP